jgi:hypothetical protein
MRIRLPELTFFPFWAPSSLMDVRQVDIAEVLKQKRHKRVELAVSQSF